MSTWPARRALALSYLLPYSLVVAGLVCLGFAVDSVPLLPRSVTGRYQRAMLATVSGLARPVDGLTESPPEPVPGGVTGESAP